MEGYVTDIKAIPVNLIDKANEKIKGDYDKSRIKNET